MLALHGVGGVVCLPILDDLIFWISCCLSFFVYAFGGEEGVASMRWNGDVLDEGGGSHIWLFEKPSAKW